jgi:hypothetical protein
MVHFCLGWLQNLILNNKPDKEEDCDDSNPEDLERQLEVSRFYETAGGMSLGLKWQPEVSRFEEANRDQ